LSVCWTFDKPIGLPGEDSNTCNGDSGGGLYVGDALTTVGVTSGGKRKDCMQGDHSYDTNVYRYSNFVSGAAAGDLGSQACGGSPIDLDRDAIGGTDKLDGGRTERAYVIDVPERSRLLRVAMNGENNASRPDFDLYLIPGDRADVEKAVCAENGSGQHAFCEVTNPSPGKWSVLIKRKGGKGVFQWVASWFPEN
jgi:hypothetical protein